ncbi:MAG: methylenetetrahydrofolate reductase [NAD(P)H] [Deltaproteobacteria bacterium]|nr:methylenetetrahydrofolate reductase [NAD(P)H] [Deltaproteobacteria bacterium]
MKLTTFKQISQKEGHSLSFEFFPPKTSELLSSTKVLMKELSQFNPDFMSVTYGAGGGTRELTFDLVYYITSELQQSAVAHLTCIGHSKSEIEAMVSKYRSYGINNILALRGDPPAGQKDFVKHPDGFENARNLTKFISSLGGISIAVAGYPEKHLEAISLEADIKYLKEKIDAGADVIMTQMFFDSTLYFRFLEKTQKAGITVPILPGIMPISNISQLKRFTSMCGASIPQSLSAQLAGIEGKDEEVVSLGIHYATKLILELLAGGAPGAHIFTLNKSHQTREILRNLQDNGKFLS